MKIAVAGGTGTVGRHVVRSAAARGHEVSILSRAFGIDVTTGEGLVTGLTGVDAVIDVTNKVTLSAGAARAFFEAATRQLLAVLTRIVVDVGETSVVELELSRFPRVHGGLSCPTLTPG